MTDHIGLSISHNFLNKENKAELRLNKDNQPSNLWAFGAYRNVHWTPQQIYAHVTAGKAICVATLKNEWRKEENFQSAQIMGVDFDEGQDVQMLVNDPFVEEYGFLIYPTPSHTAEQPRSRVLFILDNPLEDKEAYRKLVRRLLLRFESKNADEKCKDSVRQFFGSTHLGYSEVDTARLPIALLENLPKHPAEDRPIELPPQPFVTSIMDGERFRNYIEKAVDEELRELVAAKTGRNQALYVTARGIGELVGASWTSLNRSAMEQNLYAAAHANGYISKDGETAARATIRSGMEAGMSEPRAQPQSTHLATVHAPAAVIIIEPPEAPVAHTNGAKPEAIIQEAPTLAPLLPERFRMSQEQVREAASGRDWLNDYVNWAVEASPLTPRIFHEAMALWLLATVSSRRMKVVVGGEDIYSNLYILIVARTTIYRKSTAMKLAKSLLNKSNLSALLLPSEATPEALFDELAGVKPANFDSLSEDTKLRWKLGRALAAQRSFMRDEVSSIFANLKKDYMAGMHELLLQGYDADSGSYDKQLKSKGITTVRDMCFSFLGATTPAMYAKYITVEELESGLIPRFAILTPDCDVPYRSPADIMETPDALIRQLRRMFNDVLPWVGGQKPSAPTIMGEVVSPPVASIGFSVEARQQLDLYRQALGHEMVQSEAIDESLFPFYARLGTMAFKVAMLLCAIDANEAPFHIENRHAYAAILICESWRESLHRLQRDIDKARGGLSDDNKVLMLIRQSGEKGLTMREIMQMCNLRPRAKAVEALTILADDGLVEQYSSKPEGGIGRPTTYYRLVAKP